MTSRCELTSLTGAYFLTTDIQDAELAIANEYVDGIIVSNHGGRQVDGCIASLDALNNVCQSAIVRAAQASGTFTVLFDSGIRTGADMIKAIALGAQGVLRKLFASYIDLLLTMRAVGRPYIQGLCLGGEDGVAEQIKCILCEFEVCLGLCGYKNMSEIQGNRRALAHKSMIKC